MSWPGTLQGAPHRLLGCVLDAIYPEHCVLCGRHRSRGGWCAAGAPVRGLGRLDRPHLCRRCQAELLTDEPPDPRTLDAGGRPLSLLGAVRVGPGLVQLVGAWKYGGVRGLAWPLAEIMANSFILRSEGELLSGRTTLVPVPLHPRRRRQRGFNQAAVLARLLAARLGLAVDTGLARRVRATRQQARIEEWQERRLNLTGAFRVEPAPVLEGRRLVLMDDLITSGSTVAALAEALDAAGYRVQGALALGLACSHGAQERG